MIQYRKLLVKLDRLVVGYIGVDGSVLGGEGTELESGFPGFSRISATPRSELYSPVIKLTA